MTVTKLSHNISTKKKMSCLGGGRGEVFAIKPAREAVFVPWLEEVQPLSMASTMQLQPSSRILYHLC